MKSKLAVRLSLYFSAVLISLSVIIGILFFVLFRNYTIQTHKHDMAVRAESIAAALSGYMSTGTTPGGGSGQGKGTGGYGAYLKFIDDIAGAPVWIVDENLNLLSGNLPADASQNKSFNVSDLPTDAGQVVQDVFQGKTTFSETFSSFLNAPTLTVGTPLTVGGQVVGAVLLHTSVEDISASVTQGLTLLSISILLALVITVIMSAFLARKFTTPLKKMTASTALLAAGDYEVKTNIRQQDEIGALAISIDSLSERLNDARRATENLDRLRRDFVSNVSHELRTPVTVLRGSLEALNDGVIADPAQVKAYYRQMLEETLSLQRLVNDLMELSRLQNTDFTIDMSTLNLHDILTDALRSAGHLADMKQVHLTLEADTQTLSVTGDYGRLKQMFLVVLDNAVKFSPEGSNILVSLQHNTVTIQDQGPGIPPDQLPYIFDRFYKTKAENNKSGTGLGLAIARQIADRHGITLTAESRPGTGATFRFVL